MKKVLVTGAFGFAGANLVEHMSGDSYLVFALGREGSSHNNRCKGLKNVVPVYCEMENYGDLPGILREKGGEFPDAVIHLAWGGGRDDEAAQEANVKASLDLMEAAHEMGVKRFVGIGSQAEYGIKDGIITEDLPPSPFSAYGRCKVKAYELLGQKAREYNMEFIWGRIFSLIGKYEPSGRMFPDLVSRLKKGEGMILSSCEQYWDYLDAEDAAEAILALLERGLDQNIYNIANGDYRPLKEFTERTAKVLLADPELITYGDRPKPFVSLKPSVDKIYRDTGWRASISFEETIKNMI
ncbi:NAD-dependent epimerase/dehydratase family protein [Butyrivibrio sp. AE3009]|uniref:NAD-dependent epimerase/dehydratase family protein n=1 Tax=Butyrivibrio sp. AE3009 TaxID=1280666 RepID=UPI0003B3C68E|nr:NAD(P)-dependent oxidoreductase [Butyrivibrio sp. AE3009]